MGQSRQKVQGTGCAPAQTDLPPPGGVSALEGLSFEFWMR